MGTAPLIVAHPRSLTEAAALAGTDARIVAGGTALQLDWARGVARPGTLIDLGHIPGLDEITHDRAVVRIGALTRLSTLATDTTIRDHLPLLAAAVRTVAGPAVRNLATIGGNVAGRTGCLLPSLLALDASLELVSPTGRRTEVLERWLSSPGGAAHAPNEIVAALLVAPMAGGGRWVHRKIGLRAAFTPGMIGVAGHLALQGAVIRAARLAVGGGIVCPARLGVVEAALAGLSFTDVDWERIRAALLSEIRAPDDAFRTGRYRRMVAANALVAGFAGMAPAVRRGRKPMPEQAPPAGEIRIGHAEQAHRWHVRPDVADKIGGTLAYLTDHRAPGMLVGRILRAARPHARILSIDTERAEALPGVAAVVTHRDIGGQNAFGIVVQDQPAFCFDKVRHAGDIVAAVAAVDAETAEAALALIHVDYEALPLVDTPEGALLPDAPEVHAGGNLQRVLHFTRGDVAAGFRAAVHVVEETYTTSRQAHGFMETEGGHARVEPDGTLSIFVGGQHGARDRLQMARILDRAEETIRVVTSPTGGAFGGKDELTVQPALALLALKSGRPVRLQLSRAESMLSGIKRHPMTIRMRTACDAAGRLVAQEVDVLADAGAYASLGPGVLETALEHATGPYLVPHIETRGRLAYTNNGLCGAFRGFGANQMTYAIECQMDALAARCGLTPVEIRRRNLRRPGMPGYLGQEVAPSERLAEMLQAAAASPLWATGHADAEAEEIVGTGMALNYQGNGLGSLVPDPAGGRLSLGEDGRIEAAFGMDEMGQGLMTSIQAAVAGALGCGRDDVRPIVGDTGATPDSGSTTASRGGHVVWRVATMAGARFSDDLLAAAADVLHRPVSQLRLAPGGIIEAGSNSRDLLLGFRDLARALTPETRPTVSVSFDFPKNDHVAGNARYVFAFGACLARVAVNRVTGAVRVLDIHQHTAAGPVIDIAAYLGQMEGGAIQGLGFTLTEDAIIARGATVTTNFDSYVMPGIRDTAARMAVFALEELDAGDTLGPRGAGELGIGAITPALANAVADAIGHRPATIPFSPEAILDALGAT